jgi:predicted transcriptional regulator
MKKQKVLDTVNELPQEFDLEELIERLILIEKIENGLEQLDGGKSVSHNEVKEIIKEWQK